VAVTAGDGVVPGAQKVTGCVSIARSHFRVLSPRLRRAGLAAVFVGGLTNLVAGQAPATPPAAGPAAPSRGAAAPGQAAPQAPPPSQASIDHAAQVLAAARKALGGDKLAALKSVDATGRTRRLRGNNIQPIEFEMSIELPDKYLRKDEFPAEESDPTSVGFNGANLVQNPPPVIAAPPARAGQPPPTPEQLDAQRKARLAASVTTAKQDFARLALGMFASTFDAVPLTFAYVGQAEAPQGKADVIDGKGAGNVSWRLYVNADTHVPIMLSWQGPPTGVVITVPGQPLPQSVAPGAVVVTGPPAPAATASQAEKDQYAKDVQALRTKTQAAPIEYRLYYADYRDVEGVQFPFRLRRAIGTDTTEETTFDRFRLNTKIDPKKFDPVK